MIDAKTLCVVPLRAVCAAILEGGHQPNIVVCERVKILGEMVLLISSMG